jgi:hypothetical protein
MKLANLGVQKWKRVRGCGLEMTLSFVRYVKNWGKFVRTRAGCLLAPLEDFAVAVGDQLGRAIVSDRSTEATAEETLRCPKCGQTIPGGQLSENGGR